MSPAFSPSHGDRVLVPGNGHTPVDSSHTNIPGLKNLFADPLSSLKNLSIEWMLDRAAFHQIVVIYDLPDINLFTSALHM